MGLLLLPGRKRRDREARNGKVLLGYYYFLTKIPKSSLPARGGIEL